MMLVQIILNVFGPMDILPFTGVTFPFASMGGTSLLAFWMLLAFVKACDTRKSGSFAVMRPERFSGGAGVDDGQGGYEDDGGGYYSGGQDGGYYGDNGGQDGGYYDDDGYYYPGGQS